MCGSQQITCAALLMVMMRVSARPRNRRARNGMLGQMLTRSFEDESDGPGLQRGQHAGRGREPDGETAYFETEPQRS